MVADTVFYSYVPSSLHPDTLAMICFNVFFPWIGHTVELPQPASSIVVEAINHPRSNATRAQSKSSTKAASRSSPPPTSAVHPRDTVVSFGGGVDS